MFTNLEEKSTYWFGFDSKKRSRSSCEETQHKVVDCKTYYKDVQRKRIPLQQKNVQKWASSKFKIVKAPQIDSNYYWDSIVIGKEWWD